MRPTAPARPSRNRAGASPRIPSLDGLRAVSISLVLCGHLAGTPGTPGMLSAAFRNPWIDIAYLGVRIFFVISGLLITTLLLQERADTATISLRGFIWRRTLRIVPAYALFLIAVSRLLAPIDWAHALTWTVNYHADRPWMIGHLWSLSVEEQFYAGWPLLLLLLDTRRAMIGAAAVVFVAPILRVLYLHGSPTLVALNGLTFETAADSIAVGCLLAYHRDRLWVIPRWRCVVSSQWTAPGVFLAGLILSLSTSLGMLLGYTLFNLAAALLIERSVRLAPAWLNTKAMVFVGSLSYSLYLFQQPFLNRGSTAIGATFPINLLLAIGCALVCHFAVERPALALRRHRPLSSSALAPTEHRSDSQ